MILSHTFSGLQTISLRWLSIVIIVVGCFSASLNFTTPAADFNVFTEQVLKGGNSLPTVRRSAFSISAKSVDVPWFLTRVEKEPSHIRVMTFNIRYDEPNDKENAWPHRKSLVASMIRFHHADLVGVQEALARQLKDLDQLLPEYSWVGVGRADGRAAGEFSAIFYRKSRFKHLESSTYWLSETPQVPSTGWDAALPRIVTWVKLQDLQTGKIFYHFNTHFDHRGVRARDESARLLLDRTAQMARNLPAVVTGDFNFTESSDGYKILTGNNSALRDARYISEQGHHGPTSTFNEFKALIPDRKIDYVFVKGKIRVLQHGALSDTWDGRFPSDHLPVLAEIVFE
jgi:endonuclease/exonuclease/phosphatase family metal-dependent hydrolase